MTMNLDLNNLGQSLSAQFQGLSGRHPGLWPIAPRLLCGAGGMAASITLGYFAYWSSQFEDQDKGAQDEVKLKEEYKTKMAQAINLDALRAQKVQVDKYVERLQKQLPSKAEMAALLDDITHAGTGRGLNFESFKPGQVVVKDYYAELPIDIKITGSYHDIGAFAADMANMPRIVTLNSMNLNAGKDGGALTLEAVAKTFRYLDPDEVQAQRKLTDKSKDKKGGKK
jgi:type IV pilus assembly protein PilO